MTKDVKFLEIEFEQDETEDLFETKEVYKNNYRLLVMLKYIYIGGADIGFWWSVWLLSDFYRPIQTYGLYSYLRGYGLIIFANLLYLILRVAFKDTFSVFWETHHRSVYPTAIVTYKRVYQQKSLKFRLIKKTFPICIYILVIGFIQIWRGLFATFGVLIDLLHTKYSVNPILSCVVAQMFVALTLAFTQKNNAINLCPTHKMYKYDELYFTDHLFFLNLFGNFRQPKPSEVSHQAPEVLEHFCETIQNPNFLDVPGTPNLSASRLSDGDFDVVEFATARLINALQRNRLREKFKQSCTSLSSLRQEGENFDPVNTWKMVIQLVLEKQEFEEGTKVTSSKKISLQSSRKISVHTRETKKSRKISSVLVTPRSAPLTRKMSTTHDAPQETHKAMRKSNHLSPFDAMPGGGIRVNVRALEALQSDSSSDEELAALETKDQSDDEIKTSTMATDQSLHTTTTKVEQPSHPKKRLASSLKRPHVPNLLQRDNIVTLRERYMIKFFGWLYAIHHRQVFLHIFGGLFWSTTWKLFDFATESIFTKTASDIPGLVLIAIFCHSMNHLVLFRFKEMASKIHWKTFWEFFCGLFTVCLWAPTWYAWDLLLNSIGASYMEEVCWSLNVLAFLPLALLGLSINTAL
ncbi:uncharacterized protein [Clytia hemisphaerica]